MTKKLFFIITAIGTLICRGDEPKPAPPPVPPSTTSSERKPLAKSAETTPAKPAGEKAEPDKAPDVKVARQEALKTIRNIVAAVEQFDIEYDHLPVPASAVKDADCNSDTSVPESLTAILNGTVEDQNSRRINFLGALPTAKQHKGKTTGGLLVEEGEASLYDPWGNTYRAVLDLDHDGKLDNPNPRPPAGMPLELKERVVVWSAGPDGKEDTWDDNITSWESE